METAKMPYNQRMDQENVIFIHSGILLNHKEEWNFVIRKQMDGTREHLKLSWPGSEGQKSHVLPHMQIIDLKQMQ
jgi:hypothetical protein